MIQGRAQAAVIRREASCSLDLNVVLASVSRLGAVYGQRLFPDFHA